MAPAFLNGFIIERHLCPPLLIIPTALHAKAGLVIIKVTMPIPIFSWEQWLEDQMNTINFQTIELIFESSEPMTYVNTPLIGALAFFSAHP